MGTIAASVLLKLFINGNERCHTTDAPGALAERFIHYKHYKVSNPREPEKNITSQRVVRGRSS